MAKLTTVTEKISAELLEFDPELKLKIGTFEKTPAEIEKVFEDQLQYQEIFEAWFPYEELSPEKLKAAPKRIMREFILTSVADLANDISNEPISKRNLGVGLKLYFKRLLLRFKIDSIELEQYLRNSDVDPEFIETFIKWIFL